MMYDPKKVHILEQIAERIMMEFPERMSWRPWNKDALVTVLSRCVQDYEFIEPKAIMDTLEVYKRHDHVSLPKGYDLYSVGIQHDMVYDKEKIDDHPDRKAELDNILKASLIEYLVSLKSKNNK